jgi:recombination protein RecR
MIPLAQALHNAAQQVRECAQCGNLDSEDPCSICNNPNREASQICVVAQVSDVWAIERTGFYRGHYHVLGGVLSALDGIGPEQLKIPALIARTLDPRIREIILALSATVDGQTTAHYIHDHLDTSRLTISRLAQGMPMGGQLDYLDDGTIITALRARGAA